MTEQRESQGDALERIAKVGTYRTLGEQKLSPAEERFEKARRTIGLFLAPLIFIVFLLLPLDMEAQQQRLAAALLFVIVLWISEAIPIPIGAIWSGAQMLEHLGEEEAAAAVLAALEEMLANNGPRTRDLGGTATTAEVTAALTERFARR